MTRDIRAEVLRNALKTVLGEEGESSGHEYRRFAGIALTGAAEGRIEAFIASVTKLDRREALEFQEWESLKNNLVAYAVRLGVDKVAAIVLIDYCELDYSDQVTRCEAVSRGSAHRCGGRRRTARGSLTRPPLPGSFGVRSGTPWASMCGCR